MNLGQFLKVFFLAMDEAVAKNKDVATILKNGKGVLEAMAEFFGKKYSDQWLKDFDPSKFAEGPLVDVLFCAFVKNLKEQDINITF